MVTPNQLIQFSPRFQRAVHLRYDLRDQDALERYIPTTTAVGAIKAILRGAEPDSTQRSHVLHASYGSGKSLLAVTLAALVEKREELLPTLEAIASRISDTETEVGQLAFEFIHSPIRLLPVVLSGNEGDFAAAILRALTRALKENELDQIKLESRFELALRTIELWSSDYPDTFIQLQNLLLEKQGNIDQLQASLKEHDTAAFEAFEKLYPRLAAGALFDRFSEQSPEIVYREVANAISAYGYNGIVVLWDEFGRYLEGRTAQVFGNEAALLQSFAETCNYSGSEQIHLLLFAHKELQSYAASLPKTYQQEWSRIEGRFQRHNVASDPYVGYRLIAGAIQQTDSEYIQSLIPQNLIAQTVDARLFSVLSTEEVRQLVQALWPLHPLTTYALIRLSNRVAQNERTMFTFLTAEEPKALRSILEGMTLGEDGDSFVRLNELWDYFDDAIRSDTNGAHRIWSGVTYALDKIAAGDVLSETIVKTLGVLLICRESNIARPTTELLAWAVNAQTAEQEAAVITALDNLRRRKVIINRRIDDFWTFTSGSDIDFEQKLVETIERVNPTHLQLRRLLEHVVPAPNSLARRYNQQHAITRYFIGLYRWAHELVDAPWQLQREQLGNTDGLVVYVLATNEFELEQARDAIQADEQVIYVLPHQPLRALFDSLRDWFGLHELNNDPGLKQHEDRIRIERELNWLIEDAEVRVQRELDELTDPRSSKADWVVIQNDFASAYPVSSHAQTTVLVSGICDHVFGKTPIFNSEGLNRHQPTGAQIKAAQKLIDAMLTNDPSPTFGLEGNGPEILALNSLLKLPGILQQGNEAEWLIDKPSEEQTSALATIWNLIATELHKGSGIQVEPLIAQLISPPYGLRRGVLPVLLASVLYNDLKVTTIRRDNRAIHPLSGELFVDIVLNPARYTIEIGEWNDALESLWRVVISRFGNYMHETEKHHQPMVVLQLSTLRWLQSLPHYCRQTQQVSKEAQRFRDLIRVAQTEPSKVLFEELPKLLNIEADANQTAIEARLDSIMSEISNSYLDLQRRLDAFAISEFGHHHVGKAQDGANAMLGWIDSIQAESGASISQLRFGSLITQELVQTVVSSRSANGQFWDKLSNAVMGVHLRDWSDQTETKFYDTLTRAHSEVEREVHELHAEEEVVAITVQLPDQTEREFRFRSSDLSLQGKRILQNFKSTMEISGRPLSADERRQIAVAFLFHMMGEIVEA